EPGVRALDLGEHARVTNDEVREGGERCRTGEDDERESSAQPDDEQDRAGKEADQTQARDRGRARGCRLALRRPALDMRAIAIAGRQAGRLAAMLSRQ